MAAWRLQSLCFALAGLATACGPSGPPTKWIPGDLAAVHCTSAGRQRMPPTLLGLPVTPVPTGFYARGMDPIALEDLGFERDKVACAVLIAPTEGDIATATESIRTLDATYRGSSLAATQAGGRCVCEVAGALGVDQLLIACADRETQTGCDPTAGATGVAAAVEPIQAQVRETDLPFIHWRLAGWTDRPGWFAERANKLAPRHTGGSVVYRRGQAIPARDNYVALRALLEADDVTAVVRQDGGRAVLVVREIGSELVFDLFTQPVLDGAHRQLIDALANERPAAYLDALAPPEATRAPMLDPSKGNLIEVDRAGLDAVDRMMVALSPFSGTVYQTSRETPEDLDALARRVTFQAPFGHEGQKLVARVELTPDGSEWAQTLTDDILSPTLSELNLNEQPTPFEPADSAPPFVLRGSAANESLFYGLYAMPEFMSKVEVAFPSTVKGRATSWHFELPADDLASVVEGKKMERFREILAERSYVVESEFDSARQVLTLTMTPR